MAATDDLVRLLGDLRTNGALQAAFRQDRGSAVAAYELTGHERDAVVTLDLDDFVALGLVSTTSQLPPVMLATGGPRLPGWIPGWFRRVIDRFRAKDSPPIDPRPPAQGPLPGPLPPPGPGPDPDPPPGD
jgi:hypothetical protein